MGKTHESLMTVNSKTGGSWSSECSCISGGAFSWVTGLMNLIFLRVRVQVVTYVTHQFPLEDFLVFALTSNFKINKIHIPSETVSRSSH